MSALLYACHDRDSHPLIPAGGWIVESIALAENPQPQNWTQIRGDINWILRLNYAHNGRDGTIPLRGQYAEFAKRCTDYMAETKGCNVVVIGNEPNHKQEYPNGVPISPEDYAECFNLCFRAITHERPDVEVCTAAVAPWDITSGIDWLAYYKRMLAGVIECDGLAVHGYSHGADPNLIWSLDKTHGWYWHFPVIYQTIQAIPSEFATRPVHVTETDQGDHAWADANSGWVQNAYKSVNDHNNTPGTQKICSLALYRWRGDKYAIYDKPQVQADFNAAVAHGYRSPIVDIGTLPTPPDPPGSGGHPEPPRPTPEPEPEPIDWDPRLTVRGCKRLYSDWPMGSLTYVTQIGRWFNQDEAQGRVSVYVRLLDEQGRLVIGEPVTWFWSSGSETKLTERKSDPWLASHGLGAEYSLDFAMYNVAPSYGIRIDGDYAGDIINGCGLGSIEQPDYKIHTAYFFEWQLSSEGITVPEPPVPTPTPPVTARGLLWPVAGTVTQHFGEGDPQFGQKAHNGIDIAVPEGTPVVCIADGEVMYSGADVSYGLYVRVYHPSIHSHSFYAHLSEIDVQDGQPVKQGDTLGASGSTGNSTGPHLHLELRSGTRDSYTEPLCYGYTNGRYDPVVAYAITGSPTSPTSPAR